MSGERFAGVSPLFRGVRCERSRSSRARRGEVVDRAVYALVVEPLNPARGSGLDLVDVSPWAFVVDEFGLVEADLRLREGVVVRVANGPDRGINALIDEPVREGNRRVNAARIGMVRQPCEPGHTFTAAGPERHLEAVQHERCCHGGGGAPAEDATGVRVEHERDIHPSGPRPHVREVGHPELVGAEPREVAVDEVSRPALPRIRIDGPLPFPTDHPGNPEVSHEPFDRAAGDVMSVTTKAEPRACGHRLQDLVRPPQLSVLPLEPLNLDRGVCGDTGPVASVDLLPTDPGADRITPG